MQRPKNMPKFVYVYYTCKGFEKHGEYGRPEIRIFELRWNNVLKEYYLGNSICEMVSQVDTKTRRPYSLHLKASLDFFMYKPLQKFIKAFEKHGAGFNNYRGVIKALKAMKIPRWINTRWLPYPTILKNDKWIPYEHKGHPELFIEAVAAGMSLLPY